MCALGSFLHLRVGMLVPRTMGLLVIGDEILNGKVEEINSRLVCTTAPSLGLKLRKISVVPDNIDIIAKEAREFMHNFDIVLTSGGIGPTHDDMTFEGLAKALGQKTFTHPELMHVVENFFGFDSTVNPSDPRIRLSQVPVSSELVYGIDYSTGRQSNYPVVKVRNIYALPGIPRLFHTAFEIIKEHLRDPRIRFHSRSLYVTQEETQIAVFLSGLAEKYNEALSVGSYPTIDNNYYRVRVVLDSLDEKILAVAFQEAKEYFASDTVAYEPDPVANAKEAVYSLLRDGTVFSGRVAKAIGIIEAALKQFTPAQLVIGFNGGKDCTVLLHLIYAVICQQKSKCGYDSDNAKEILLTHFPKLLYIRSRSVFPELESFVQHTLRFYRLPSSSIFRSSLECASECKRPHHCGSLIVYEGNIKSSIERLLQDFPDLRGVFMGTRLSDPKAADLTPMIMTDPGWPQILRINPLLDWTYADVWTFIRKLSLPYCSLYDVGYTSIGSMEDTHPNPKLRHITESGRIEYHPAYTLTDLNSERFGRRGCNPSS